MPKKTRWQQKLALVTELDNQHERIMTELQAFHEQHKWQVPDNVNIKKLSTDVCLLIQYVANLQVIVDIQQTLINELTAHVQPTTTRRPKP